MSTEKITQVQKQLDELTPPFYSELAEKIAEKIFSSDLVPSHYGRPESIVFVYLIDDKKIMGGDFTEAALAATILRFFKDL